MYNSESVGVSVSPFKVVKKTPAEVTRKGYPLLHSPPGLLQMVSQTEDPVGVIHLTGLINNIIARTSVLCEVNGLNSPYLLEKTRCPICDLW